MTEPPTEPAASGLICLAYLSSATHTFGSTELEALAEASARNNTLRGVTGMLCHYDGSFLQFLEGPAPEVEATLARIRRDPRHAGVLPIYREPIRARVFGAWAMAVTHPDRLSVDQRRLLTNLRTFDWPALGAPQHRVDLELLLATFRSWLR